MLCPQQGKRKRPAEQGDQTTNDGDRHVSSPLPDCPERRIISPVEEDLPLDLIAVQDRPATPLCRVHLIVPVPGELDGGLPVPLHLLVIDPTPYVAELKLTGPIPLELEVPLDLL